jgi:hypothetical protein
LIGNGFLTEDEQAEMQSFEKLSDWIARGHERISFIPVKFCRGKVVEAEITAIVNQSAGRKTRIFYDNKSVVINPEQTIEVLD